MVLMDIRSFFNLGSLFKQLAIIGGLWLFMFQAAWSQPVKLQQTFKNVELKKVIEAVAKLTRQNYIIDPRVKGKVTLIAPEPMEPEALQSTLLAILRVHGYVAVPEGEVIKVVPANLARNQLPYKTEVSLKKPAAGDAWVTEVLSVQNVEATKLVALLRPLVAREGHLVALAQSNQLVITDTLSNIKRIKAIVARLDLPSTGRYEILSLKHASAKEIAKTLKPLLPSGNHKPKVTYDERSNRLIVQASEQERLQIRALVAQLDTPIASEGNVSVVYLHYAKAKDLVPILQKVASSPALVFGSDSQASTAKKGGATSNPSVKSAKQVAKDINIQADERMNAVVISAPPTIVTALKRVIKQLDIRRAQVLIEAILVEVSEAKQAELGVEWAANGPNGVGAISFSGSLATILGNVGNPAAQAQAIGRGVTGGVGEVNANNQGWLALIRALNSDANANILSTPTLLTLDNEEAEIIVGKEVPFRTGSYSSTGNASTPTNPFQTIERKNVGLKLKIKPQINQGDEVYLEINQELSDVLPKGDAVDLETSKREIQTKVIVGDGNVIVLGGLITERETEVTAKVPGLGDLPLIGGLFRTKSNQREKVNLMVFLRPVIIRDAKMSNFYSQQKYTAIQQTQQQLLQEYDSGMLEGLRPKMPGFQSWQQGQTEGLSNRTQKEAAAAKAAATSQTVERKSELPSPVDESLEILGF